MSSAIGEVILNIVRDAKERHSPISEIQNDWPRVVGKKLCAHTKPASLSRGKLTVFSDEPGSSFMLDIEKPRILKKLVRLDREGKWNIKEIITRAGEIS